MNAECGMRNVERGSSQVGSVTNHWNDSGSASGLCTVPTNVNLGQCVSPARPGNDSHLGAGGTHRPTFGKERGHG